MIDGVHYHPGRALMAREAFRTGGKKMLWHVKWLLVERERYDLIYTDLRLSNGAWRPVSALRIANKSLTRSVVEDRRSSPRFSSRNS